MPKRSDLRRRKWFRHPLARFLIVCEGEVTETYYFSDLKRLEKIPVELKFRSGASPKTLVEWALEEKKTAERLAKRDRDNFSKFDEVWVVCDTDDHPLMAEAKQQATANGIKMAISNPCFELWALLHFQEQFAYVHRDKLRELCVRHIPRYEKRLPVAELIERYKDALDRANRLQQWHASRDTPGANPSTDVHKLVERMRAERQRWNSEHRPLIRTVG